MTCCGFEDNSGGGSSVNGLRYAYDIGGTIYHAPGTTTFSNGVQAGTINTLFVFPFQNRMLTAVGLAMETTIGAAGNLRYGLYDSNVTTGLPSTLIEDLGSQSIADVGIIATAFATPREMCNTWLVFNMNAAATFRALAGSSPLGQPAFGQTAPNGVANTMGLSAASAFGALPADLTGTAWGRITASPGIYAYVL